MISRLLTQALALLLINSSLHDTVGFTIQPPLNVFTSSSTPITTLAMARQRGRPRGPVRTIEVKPPMNAEIRFAELRVTISGTPLKTSSTNNVKDEVLGVMSKEEALAKAKEMGGLDLILINENSDPPVAKIADYSKYRYEKEKKAKEAKKNSKNSEMKEVKMSYKIGTHDYGVRVKNASKFINQGNRVKCTVQFKGREMQHDQLGFELLERIAEDLTKICIMDGKPKREGRSLTAILSPRPQVTKALNDKKRNEEKAKRKQKLDSKKGGNSDEDDVAKESAAVASDLAGGSDETDVDSSLTELVDGVL